MKRLFIAIMLAAGVVLGGHLSSYGETLWNDRSPQAEAVSRVRKWFALRYPPAIEKKAQWDTDRLPAYDPHLPWRPAPKDLRAAVTEVFDAYWHPVGDDDQRSRLMGTFYAFNGQNTLPTAPGFRSSDRYERKINVEMRDSSQSDNFYVQLTVDGQQSVDYGPHDLATTEVWHGTYQCAMSSLTGAWHCLGFWVIGEERVVRNYPHATRPPADLDEDAPQIASWRVNGYANPAGPLVISVDNKQITVDRVRLSGGALTKRTFVCMRTMEHAPALKLARGANGLYARPAVALTPLSDNPDAVLSPGDFALKLSASTTTSLPGHGRKTHVSSVGVLYAVNAFMYRQPHRTPSTAAQD